MGSDTVAARVSKLGYVEFTTPDPDRMVEYYTTCLGFHVVERSPAEAYLTTGVDHHSVVIRKGGAAGRTSVGYQVAGSIDDAQERLADAGYEVSRRSDIAPSTPDVLVLAEPGTDVPLHLYGSQAASGAGPVPPTAHEARPRGRVQPEPEADPGLLPGPVGLPVVGHHRRLLRVPALQRRPPRGELPGEREALRHAPRRLRDARPQPPADHARSPGAQRLPPALGTRAARAGAQRLHLPPRPGRQHRRAVHPARLR